MRKRLLTMLSMAFALAAPMAWAVPQEWSVDVSRVQPYQFNAYHGETMELKASFFLRGQPYDVAGDDFALFWQTNGMGSAYWSAPATAASNTVSAVFTGAMDPGAPLVYGFIGSTGSNYRASFAVRFAASPGAAPNELPLPVETIDFSKVDAINAPWATAAEIDTALTNYYTRGEADSVAASLRESVAVAASSATNYPDAVAASLGALAWVDSVDWADILGKPSWIGDTKPTYSLNDVCPNVENWLGVPGTTAGGKSIKVLAKTVNGVIEGGMTVTGSSNNDNNTTKYRYGGVTATRNGTATDYLFDTSSQSGIVRRSELAPVSTLSSKVSALETWAIGDETQLHIENAGQTNATLQITYTNDLMFSTAVAESNTLAKARADATALDLALADAFDTALAGKADRAWGNTTSSGAPSPTDTLVVEKPKLALTGGGNFSYIEADVGGYWVMSVSLGSEWTLESLADAQNPTNPATIAMHDAEGNTAYTITSTSSREAYAVDGEQYIYCRSIGGNDVITLTYPVVADSAPTIEYAPSLTDEFAPVDNWPGYIASVVPTGHSGMWTNTVTMVGHPGEGFFKGKYTKAGHTYTRFNQPIGITQITIDDVTYNISVETINGKKLMVLTEAD